MKKYPLAVISAVLVLAAGCSQEMNEVPETPFMTASIAEETTATKAAYDDEMGKFQWTPGDQIAVPYAGTRLEVYDLDIDATDPSVATVVSSQKGADTRIFYAVYPASAWVTPETGATSPIVNLKSSYSEFAAIIAGTSDLTADYSPVPMVAVNDPSSKVLDFRHVGGLLRLICSGMKPTTKTVVVTFDKDVTGDYEVNVDDPEKPYIQTNGSSSNNKVTFTVATANTGIGNDVTDFVLNVPVPCGRYEQVKVEAFDNAGKVLLTRVYADYPILFERHHGKRLSFSELEWEYHLDGTLSDVQTEYNGGLETITLDLGSYKEDDDENKQKVPFEVEYSDDGSDGSWTSTKPDWLVMGGGIDYNGTVTGQSITVAISPQANSIPLNSFGIPVDQHTLRLRANTPKTTDLSRYNVATGTVQSSVTTANCYVVQAPGTYTFPLVYGNGIKDGAINEVAYHAKTGDINSSFRNSDVLLQGTAPNGGYDLGYFKDHLNGDIKTPYIASQLATKGLSIQKAELLWTDAKGLISSVQYLPGNASDNTDDRISFTITQEGINQGNAVIAVYDSAGRIAWSWHIWVTDADLTKTEPALNNIPINTLNLGWCDRKVTEKYEPRHCYIRFVQPESGLTSSPVLVNMEEGPTVVLQGNAPFYYFGRKDPLPSADGNMQLLKDKPCYTITGEPFIHEYAIPGAGTIAEGIQHPDYQYVNSGTFTWCFPSYRNPWSSTYTDAGALQPITKTIYDPSPVGYKMPPYGAYQGFTDEQLVWVENYSMPMVDASGNTYNQPMGSGRKYGNLFFPASGARSITVSLGGAGAFITGHSYWHADGYNDSYVRFSRTVVISTSGGAVSGLSVRCTTDN